MRTTRATEGDLHAHPLTVQEMAVALVASEVTGQRPRGENEKVDPTG